jgi:hypothetical protein
MLTLYQVLLRNAGETEQSHPHHSLLVLGQSLADWAESQDIEALSNIVRAYKVMSIKTTAMVQKQTF